MLLNSTDLSKSFSFGMLLINERLSLIPPSHSGWFFGLLLSRSLFIYIKWVGYRTKSVAILVPKIGK